MRKVAYLVQNRPSSIVLGRPDWIPHIVATPPTLPALVGHEASHEISAVVLILIKHLLTLKRLDEKKEMEFNYMIKLELAIIIKI